MSIKDNGGSAFPVLQRLDSPSHEYKAFSSEGMTLRDYFAAKAMAALLLNGVGSDYIASGAYAFADAMLRERAK